MASAELLDLLHTANRENGLSDQQLSVLRQHVYADGHIDVNEADMLFQINTTSKTLPEAWKEFFVGVITDFLIRQTPPKGYIDESNAAWLMARIDHDGVVDLETELELLLYVMRQAKRVPERLERYALEQVRASVLEGRGYVATQARHAQPRQIDSYEVELLRHLLYASAGSNGIGISRLESEFLFDLDEATRMSSNHPSWKELFVKANANHLMLMGSASAVSLDEARRQEEWIQSETGLEFNLVKSFKSWFSQKDEVASRWLDTTGIEQAEKIDAMEAAWLIQCLNRDGSLSPNERALLDYLAAESPEIHQSLLPFIQAA